MPSGGRGSRKRSGLDQRVSPAYYPNGVHAAYCLCFSRDGAGHQGVATSDHSECVDIVGYHSMLRLADTCCSMRIALGADANPATLQKQPSDIHPQLLRLHHLQHPENCIAARSPASRTGSVAFFSSEIAQFAQSVGTAPRHINNARIQTFPQLLRRRPCCALQMMGR